LRKRFAAFTRMLPNSQRVKTSMKRALIFYTALALLLAGGALAASGADFEAGTARAKITPEGPFWMSGYAARTHRSEGVLQELWAKALALRDPQGHELVLITTDLIGIPHDLSERVLERAGKEFGLGRSNLILSCSHTHCGPAVGRNLRVLFDFGPEDERQVEDYSTQLGDKLVRIIGEARLNRAAALLTFGQGNTGFAINRRQTTPKGFAIGVNTNGPVDHSVPVLRVASPEGQLRAILFGYACHNTTLGGDFYKINGDYAGQAQSILEQAHPGVTALFMMLCGGDQNPNPRGTPDLARQHGEALAREVERVLGLDLRPVRPPILCASETIALQLAPHTREQFERELQGPDKFRERRARIMLSAYAAGNPVKEVPYPVQAVRFNRDLTLVTLGGEVVVDYVLRAKREFPSENLVVAGYCNDVMCYIPSERVLKEGGYEPVDSMIYYGMPGPFAAGIEGNILGAIARLVEH
jgi:neutral ceramidase